MNSKQRNNGPEEGGWRFMWPGLDFLVFYVPLFLLIVHIETRNRNNTKTNVHMTRSTQYILKRLNHDVIFKKTRINT
jgi:hypothetical protein